MNIDSDLLLYAVSDRRWTNDFYKQIIEVLDAGITCLQLREKDLSNEEFLKEALTIKELCDLYHIPLIINDNVEVAIKCQANGIHIGQDDMPLLEVRKLAGKDMIIGVSVHNKEEALLAYKNGADYLGVGAMFTTCTKDSDILKLETLKEICSFVDIPVVAIGGINKDNILLLKDSGISGVAVVSAIFASNNIKESCQILRKLLKEI